MPDNQIKDLTEHETKLILYLRELKYGEVKVFVKDGVPIRGEDIKQSVQF